MPRKWCHNVKNNLTNNEWKYLWCVCFIKTVLFINVFIYLYLIHKIYPTRMDLNKKKECNIKNCNLWHIFNPILYLCSSTHWWEQHTCLLCGYTPSSIFNFDIFQPSRFTERPMRSEGERVSERLRERHRKHNEGQGAALCSRKSDDKHSYKCPSGVSE